MTERQIHNKLKKFMEKILSKYPNIYRTDKEDDSDKADYYIKIRDEFFKYYPAEDVDIENYDITHKSGRVDFSIDHPKRNSQTSVYIRFANIQGIDIVQPNLDIWIFYNGSFIGSKYLSIEKFPEVVKSFIELDNSFDKVLEEIAIEKGKDKKMSDMIGVTIKTLIEKKFGDRISEVGAYLDGNTLIVHVTKTSRNKVTFKINIKKFENNFDIVLEGVEHFLKFQSYDWLKFEYKGL